MFRGQSEAAMRYKLQVYNPATAAVEQEWILHLPATVGRSPDADVSIGDDSISRRHCQFFLNASGALWSSHLQLEPLVTVEQDLSVIGDLLDVGPVVVEAHVTHQKYFT